MEEKDKDSNQQIIDLSKMSEKDDNVDLDNSETKSVEQNIKRHRFNFQKILDSVEKTYLKKDQPLVKVGDTIRCGLLIKEGNKERTQFYEGIVISQKTNNKSINWNLTVRRIMQGIGIERIFLVHSPKLVSLIVQSSAKVRRSKLYYLRNLSGKASRLQQQFD